MSRLVTRVYDFTVTLAGALELTPEVADALYEAGCDDASPHSEGETISLDFHREAGALADAIAAAVRDVEGAGYAVARIEIEAANR